MWCPGRERAGANQFELLDITEWQEELNAEPFWKSAFSCVGKFFRDPCCRTSGNRTLPASLPLISPGRDSGLVRRLAGLHASLFLISDEAKRLRVAVGGDVLKGDCKYELTDDDDVPPPLAKGSGEVGLELDMNGILFRTV